MVSKKKRSIGYLPPMLKALQDNPQPQRGRRDKLVGKYYIGLVGAIGEIVANKDHYDLAIARKLQRRQEYSHLSVRQLRRDVAAVISDLIDEFRAYPRGYWNRLGINPPSEMTQKSQRQKAFEFLRSTAYPRSPWPRLEAFELLRRPHRN